MKTYRKWSIIKRVRTLFKYAFDKNVPILKKIIIIFGFIYLLFPMDIIPDPILGFGILDDITIILIILNLFQGELDKYERKLNKTEDKGIIEDFDYRIKEEDEGKGK